MVDEEFEKMFNKLADKFEDYLYFLSMGMCHYKDTKHGIKLILEEIELNAYEKAIQDFNDLANGKIIMKEAKP